jgi:hypothetical protein
MVKKGQDRVPGELDDCGFEEEYEKFLYDAFNRLYL